MPARLSELWNNEDIQKPYSFGLAAQSDSRFNLAYEGYLLKETASVPGRAEAAVRMCRRGLSAQIANARRRLFVAHIALWARHAGAAAAAGVFAIPWSIRVIFTHPGAVFAHWAFHRLRYLLARVSGSQSKFGRTSAPFRPHARQVNRGSMSDNRTSSFHGSPLIATW
jgi:hypothetical protein